MQKAYIEQKIILVNIIYLLVLDKNIFSKPKSFLNQTKYTLRFTKRCVIPLNTLLSF